MRKALLITTGLAWLALTGAANAAVTVLTAPGPVNPTYFASKGAGENGFTLNGITWELVSGSAATAKGTTPGVSAAPLGMGDGPTGTTYMSVEGGGVEMATFATPQTSLHLYWGSIDAGGNLNSLAIDVDGYTLTGGDLIALGALGRGDQFDPLDNREVLITGLGAFTEVTFSSSRNSFEFSLFPGVGGVLSAPATPEPATWAMMMLGFAGLGYAAFRRNTKARALAT